MECNKAQWSAMSCNNKAKKIVLSTKKALLVIVKVVHTFLQKNHKFSNLLTNAPLYYI